MGTKLAEVESDAAETKNAATEAYMKALTIYHTAFNLAVPEVDTSGLGDQANKISKDADRSRALKAVNLGKELSEKANRTLETLQEFEKRVNENRGAATDAIKKIADIERTINDANDKTNLAEEALENTDKNAFLALEVANEAKSTGESASEHATTIASESVEILDAAKQLNKDSKSLQEKYG